MNDFDWTSDIKAGETLGNIKQNNFRGYNVGDKITVTGGIYIEDYDGDRDGWIWLSNEPFMINDIIPNLGRFVLLALNEKLINNPENKHFLLNDWNELYIGDYHQDNDLLISRYIENLKEDNDFDWINDIDDSKPQKGTAWAITGIKNETDSIQCQKFLFNLGFGWVNDAKEIIYTPAKQFGSIFRGDIKHKLFGLSSKQGIDSTIEIAKGESRQDKLYHFEWVNGETKLKDIIYLTDNINESNDFDWTRDIQVTPIDNGPICETLYDEVVRYFRNKQPISYGDYYYSMDGYSGTIVWGFNDTDEYVVYATPYWEGECELNIDIQGDMGDYETIDYIELPKFEYVEALHQWLENEYPKIVVKRIKDLGPLPE